MTDIRRRLRVMSAHHDLATVIACAFDHRTRILPFIYADTRMVPAGVRAIGAAMLDCGFDKTRIVLQQWNRNFRPTQMRLDGRIPDLFMVSSMHLHSTPCNEMIHDVSQMDAAIRPLIIAGGPRVIYSPWEVFSADPDRPWGADVAVTGEEYVLLSLLEVLLSMRGTHESMRSTFLRARDCGRWTRFQASSTVDPRHAMEPPRSWWTPASNACWATSTNCPMLRSATASWNRPAASRRWASTL